MNSVKRVWSVRTVWIATLLMLAMVSTAVAQYDRATLNGTVTDASGAMIPDVKIELVSVATGFLRETVTGSKGTYQVPALPVGVYNITISKEGFEPEAISNVEFAVGQARTIDAKLQVGAHTETMEVRA